MNILAKRSYSRTTPCFIGTDINGRDLYPLKVPSSQAALTINGAVEPQPNPHSQLLIGVIRPRTRNSLAPVSHKHIRIYTIYLGRCINISRSRNLFTRRIVK